MCDLSLVLGGHSGWRNKEPRRPLPPVGPWEQDAKSARLMCLSCHRDTASHSSDSSLESAQHPADSPHPFTTSLCTAVGRCGPGSGIPGRDIMVMQLLLHVPGTTRVTSGEGCTPGPHRGPHKRLHSRPNSGPHSDLTGVSERATEKTTQWATQ